MNWTHILISLIWAFHHVHRTSALAAYYANHHAVAFLLSGRTSESPANATQAHHLLTWLISRHMNPLDW